MTLATRPTPSIEPVTTFDEIERLTLATLESQSSKRVYAQTFRLWRSWCVANDLDPIHLRPGDVLAFLADQDVTKATRQRQLSALRQLAKIIFLLLRTQDAELNLRGMEIIKVPTGSDVAGSGKERSKRALQPSEADKVLRVWDQDSNLHRRNRALIAVLALSGVRRAEAAALRWSDVDMENGGITVRHGKGDKAREVPLAGEFAIDALKAWQACADEPREYVFTPMERGDKFGADHPIDGTDVYRIVAATAKLSGIPFKPHDLRRTLITEALDQNTPMKTVQSIAGHARGNHARLHAEG